MNIGKSKMLNVKNDLKCFNCILCYIFLPPLLSMFFLFLLPLFHDYCLNNFFLLYPTGMPGPPPIGGMVVPAKKRDLPKPSNPLKSFNWAKLPDMKIQGTIWQDLDDLKV